MKRPIRIIVSREASKANTALSVIVIEMKCKYSKSDNKNQVKH